ncbi:hypothetical protein AMECASPLE_024645 [Ameca splendens]|uniref:Uncharacterized protein n=1 Tax=Ameca splendens TaxID=208324 RepID=A0ABV0YRB4_9TELE
MGLCLVAAFKTATQRLLSHIEMLAVFATDTTCSKSFPLKFCLSITKIRNSSSLVDPPAPLADSSHLDYCNQLFTLISKTDPDHLQLGQTLTGVNRRGCIITV